MLWVGGDDGPRTAVLPGNPSRDPRGIGNIIAPMSANTVFDFSTSGRDDPTTWRSVDDPVMGGVSESKFTATQDGAAFTGTVSLEHGGGFASIRAPEGTYDLRDASGVTLRMRGDGNRYWITFYTDDGGAVSYRAPVHPSTEWTTLTVDFDDLTPFRRGTHVPDAPPFDPSAIRTLGVLIADEQAGPFRLEIAWIRPLPA